MSLSLAPSFGTQCPVEVQDAFEYSAQVLCGSLPVLEAFKDVAGLIVGTNGCQLARVRGRTLKGVSFGQAALWVEFGHICMVWTSEFAGHDELLRALWEHVQDVRMKEKAKVMVRPIRRKHVAQTSTQTISLAECMIAAAIKARPIRRKRQHTRLEERMFSPEALRQATAQSWADCDD
jgi:hypothetical protein